MGKFFEKSEPRGYLRGWFLPENVHLLLIREERGHLRRECDSASRYTWFESRPKADATLLAIRYVGLRVIALGACGKCFVVTANRLLCTRRY